MTIEEKITELGLYLPARPAYLDELPFVSVRVVNGIAYISGHGALNPDGTGAEPKGKLGVDVTIEQGYELAKLTALAMLASLKRELGELERVKSWIKLLGMVNCAPDFVDPPKVINGASHLIIELYGKERGAHTRAAVGMNSLPGGMAVEIEGMCEVDV